LQLDLKLVQIGPQTDIENPMSNQITCPNCGHQFEASDAVRDEVQKELRGQMKEWQQKKEAEFQSKENQFAKQIEAKELELAEKLRSEKEKLEKEKLENENALREQIRKSIAGDFENQLTLLKEQNASTEEKLKLAREAELKMLQLEQKLKEKDQEMQIELQKLMLAESEKIKAKLADEEKQKQEVKDTQHQMQMKELQKQLEDQKGLIEQMKRKAEQGSMQLQGEVQELLLEEILQATFPFDKIEEVGKGVRGADCIQIVRNPYGQEVGRIIYESKRTKDFGNDWIEKLKTDMRSLGTDLAVIVTQALPKDMERFGEKDGVYICTFAEVRGVALLLRNGLLKIFEVRKTQENKGDKMEMLYSYLTGSEFGEQWKAIREGFLLLKQGIQKERDGMERLWKAREKQLEKVILNAAHIRGSIEGIAGADAINLNLLEESDLPLLEE